MSVKQQLKPYYRKLRIAYLIKIGLLTLLTTFLSSSLVMIFSKMVLLVALEEILIYLVMTNIACSIALGWYFRPKVHWMNKQIDLLGFDNKVVTYFDYKGKINPFNEYLEHDLSNHLSKDKHYKAIRLRPAKGLLPLVFVMLLLTSALATWQTDVSSRSEKIATAIALVEEEEVNILESLEEENLEAEELEALTELAKDQLEALKEALKDEDDVLAEQELFKMEEAIKKALEDKALSNTLEEQLNALGTTIESKNQQSLLSALGEISLQEGVLSEENSQSESTAVGSGTIQSGELSQGDASDASQEGDGEGT